MSILHISPVAARAIPALEADNNSWRVYRGTGSVIVFVHGVLSNALASWYNKKAGTYWPDMVVNDRDFNDSSVFLGGYYTAFDSTDFDLYQCARQLLSALSESGDHPAVMQHERLIFVCHSLGGVVARYMLSGWQNEFYRKKIGLLLMASPSIGSEYANVLGNPITLLRHEIGRQLSWHSDILDDLDVRFSEMLQTRVITQLTGLEACEHRFVLYRSWLGPLNYFFPRVVNLESAGRYFRPARLIPNTDHSSIVKPDSERHDSHRLLREFYKQRVEVQLPLGGSIATAHMLSDTKPETVSSVLQGAAGVADTAAPQRKPDPVFQCSRIEWNIAINEDGDAPNDITFHRIVRAEAGTENAFPMTPTWVQSGHTSRYEIDRDRSDAQATLRGEVKPRLIQQTVVFQIPPTALQPQNLMLRSIDFNVYSMDSAEFQRKETENRDDLDYVQKNIRWEQMDELAIAIYFPEAMRLRANDPLSVQAYRLIRKEDAGSLLELYDAELTIQTKAGFAFDSVRRSAILNIQKPAKWTAYRVSWRLAPPAAPPPKPAVAATTGLYRRALLSIRPLFDGTGVSDPAGDTKKEAVLKALASFGAQAIAEVNRCLATVKTGASARIDIRQLDLSLMAIEKLAEPADHEILRVVAGLNVPAAYWALELSMGDGIAGRAAKRVQFRKFCRSAQESLQNDAYLPFDKEGLQHQWLLSIPLHEQCCDPFPYGVVNLGAFDRQNAGLLDVLSDQSLEVLDKYANGDFLKSVLNAVG